MEAYQRLSRCRPELMGLAALWVMLFHAYPFRFHFFPLDAFKQLGFAGVDVFILLSAMGLYLSLHRTPEQPLSRYYLRRARRVLPTFWLVVGLYSLYLVLRGRIGWGVLAWNLSAVYYWFRIEGAFNWYIPSVLAFYLISPFYAGFLRRSRRPGWLTAAMFPVSYLIYRLTIPVHLNYTEDFVCRIPAFAMGMLIGRCLAEHQPLTGRHAATWAAGSAVGWVVTVLRLKNLLYISPCYLIGAQLVPVTLITAWCVEKLPEGLRRLLRTVGTGSLEIYLINVIVTREFDTLAPYLDRGPGHLFYYAVVYTLNLLLGIGLHRLLNRQRPAEAGTARA